MQTGICNQTHFVCVSVCVQVTTLVPGDATVCRNRRKIMCQAIRPHARQEVNLAWAPWSL